MKKLILGLVFLLGLGLGSTGQAMDFGTFNLDNTVGLYVYNYDMVAEERIETATYAVEAKSVLTINDWPGFVTVDWDAIITEEFDEITEHEFKVTYAHPIIGSTVFALGRYSYLDFVGAEEANKTLSAGVAIKF